MKLIEPKVEYLPQEEGLQGMYKQIEVAGRTCYQSQDRITEDSAKAFVDMLTKSGHGAMLEHGTIYLKVPINIDIASVFLDLVSIWTKCKLVTYKDSENNWWAITTNYRVIIENNLYDTLKYLCEPTKYHEKRYTFRFTTNIGISREINRHRANSMGEESTRFCGYNKGKFGNEITYIQPQQFTQQDIEDNMRGNTDLDTLKTLCQCIVFNETGAFTDVDYWLFAMLSAEYAYMGLIGMGWKPQDARCALNLNTKTELVHTAFESDWKHFCELRCSPAAHPEARYLANQIKDILKF